MIPITTVIFTILFKVVLHRQCLLSVRRAEAALDDLIIMLYFFVQSGLHRAAGCMYQR